MVSQSRNYRSSSDSLGLPRSDFVRLERTIIDFYELDNGLNIGNYVRYGRTKITSPKPSATEPSGRILGG
jgi:hypothetical protein